MLILVSLGLVITLIILRVKKRYQVVQYILLSLLVILLAVSYFIETFMKV